MIGFSSACAAAVANTTGSRNRSTAAGIVPRIHMAQPPSTEVSTRRDIRRCETSRFQQARQESNLQPPVLERTSSNAGVAASVDFQGLSSEPATPASLDDAGAGTIPDTARD